MTVGTFTLIVPYYRNRVMLREQIRTWEDYPDAVSIILVDDGSPEPALDVVREHAPAALLPRLTLYRIDVDIPWNRGGARNLGAKLAATDWILHVDIDHVLPPPCAERLLQFEAEPRSWYRFERYRNGCADETRKKDKIPDAVEFGKIHPHIDSYLVTRERYWLAGGYDEDYSGCLGGGSPFLKALERVAAPAMAPPDCHLIVWTRSTAKDASDWALSRDRTEYARRKREKERLGRTRAERPIRFTWSRQDPCIRAS
jgi:glycosyltransferase involved in cell wall biosynthesis